MKKNKLIGRILSCVLAFAIILGTCSTAFAAGTGSLEPTEIKYVSLGDSMSNGYGLPGYDGNNGVEDYGDGSYANLFAEWLGEDGTTVDHKQLAMSAMRAEDLHWLLELDYDDTDAIAVTDSNYNDGKWAMFGNEEWREQFPTTGDYWTWNELCDDYRFASAAYTIQNGGAVDGEVTSGEAGIVAKYYQDAVKNADIISLGMGNGNFGVFSFGRLLEAIGFSGSPEDAMIYNLEDAISECEPALQAKILELKDTLYEKVNAFLDENGLFAGDDNVANREALLNTIVYTGLSYVLNYAGSVEAILQLNPDAEIILVALMNTFAEPGAEVDYANIDSLGDVMGAIFEPLNMFIAGLPTYMQAVNNGVYKDATFYYAEAPEVECLVEVYESEINNTDSVIRSRFVESIVGYCNHDGAHSAPLACNGDKKGMVWGLLAPMIGGMVEGASLEFISIDDIVAYEAMSDAEKAAYASTNMNKAISSALYLAFEDAILAAADGATVDLNSVMGLGNLSPAMFSGVFEEFNANIETASTAKAPAALDAAKDVAAGELATGVNEAFGAPVLNKNTALGLINSADQSLAAAGFVKTVMAADITVQGVIGAYHADGNIDNVLGCTDPMHTGYCTGVQATYNTNVATLDGAVTLAKNGATSNVASLAMLLALPETLSTALQETPDVYGLLGLFARCIIGNGLGAHPSADGHIALFEAVKTAYSEGYTAKDETIKNVTAIINEYYDEAYAYAYAKADEEGYVDQAAAAIDVAIKTILNLDISDVEMTDEMRVKLTNEFVAIINTLTEIKAALIEDKAADVDGLYNTAVALWNDLNTHLTNAGAILAQAEFDVKTLLCPVIDAYVKTIIEEYVMPFVDEVGDKLSDVTLKKIDHKHYAATEDGYYVAIGGYTVWGHGIERDSKYYRLVADDYNIAKKNIYKEGILLPNEALTLIEENVEEIKKADLISYQLDATSFIWGTMFEDADWDKYINEYLEPEERELVENIVDETIRVLTMDWKDHADSKITELVAKIKVAVLEKLPEDVPFVEDIFDALVEFLLPYVQNEIIKFEGTVNEEFNLDEKITKVENNPITSLDETTKEYIEKFAFAFVTYAIETAKTVEAIEMINPDATLVVVGMHNPLRGLEIKIGENVIDAEEYFEYVIKATNHYYSLLSMTNKGFAFVDVAEAETDGLNISINVANTSEIISTIVPILNRAIQNMHANQEGHKYIANQITKALTCDYSVYEQFNETHHYIVCAICGDKSITEEHTFVENTCECGYTKPIIPDDEPNDPEIPDDGDDDDDDNDNSGSSSGSFGGGGGGGLILNQFTITFDTDGGNAVGKVVVKKGELLTEPAAPTKDGYVFAGWYTDKALTTKYDFSAPVTKSFTLYAKWADASSVVTDIDTNAWYYGYVEKVMELGLMKGVSATEFAPDVALTRGMFVTILHRIEGEATVEGGTDFTDVAADQYYANAVKWASANGIVKGISETEFAPDAKVTREQMAAMIARYAEYKKLAIPEEGDVTYTDSDQIADYAKDAVVMANKLGILIGNADGSFAPQRTATRAEASALFVRLLDVLAK